MKLELSQKFKEAWSGDANFEELMSLDGEMYRQVARRKTFKFQLNGSGYFAKIHKGTGWGEIFKNLLQGRLPVLGATNEYDAIKKLTQLGVKTMTLAAYGQRGLNIAELESFVITESLEPSISLEDYCADWSERKPPLKLKRALIKRVATITRQLHDNGINHRDLYICHFLLKEADLRLIDDIDALPLYLIDLHRVQIRKEVPIRWVVKDLAALYFSSMDIGFTKRDFYRFIREYTNKDLRAVFLQEAALWGAVKKKALYLYAKPLKG